MVLCKRPNDILRLKALATDFSKALTTNFTNWVYFAQIVLPVVRALPELFRPSDNTLNPLLTGFSVVLLSVLSLLFINYD